MKNSVSSARSTKRSPVAGVVMALVAVGSFGLFASDADPRGLLDSKVSTLVVAGNAGEGAADAKTVAIFPNGGIARDSAGAIYFTDLNRIYKQVGTSLSLFSGTLNGGFNGEGAPASTAVFGAPTYLCTDAADNLYVSDSGNFRIRKITKAGIVNTVAGNGTKAAGIADIGRVATDARIPSGIVGLAVNAAGDLFFASNSTACVYKVAAANGLLSIIAGDGTSSGLRNGLVSLGNSLGGSPTGLAVLADGTPIYSENDVGSIRNIKADGTTAVIAGVVDTITTAGVPPVVQNTVLFLTTTYPDNGTFAALQLVTQKTPVAPAIDVLGDANTVGGVSPNSLAVDGATIYFWDSNEGHIRCFTVGGKISTVFGEVSEGPSVAITGYRGNGTPATTNTPRLGLAVSAGPNLVLETNTSGDDVYDSSSFPNRIFTGKDGIIQSKPVAPSDDVAGPGGKDDQTPRNDDPLCRMGSSGLVSSGGVVTFVDKGNNLLRQFTIGGSVANFSGAAFPNRISNGFSRTVNVNNISNLVPVLGIGAPILAPGALAQDATGNLYFDATNAFSGFHDIYKYDATAKTVVLVAGRGYSGGSLNAQGDGGPAATAVLGAKSKVELGRQASVLADGSVIFADPVLHTIRMVNAAGIISTIGGFTGQAGNNFPDGDPVKVKADGTSDTAIATAPAISGNSRVGHKPLEVAFNAPQAVLATDALNYWIADTGNASVVQVVNGVITLDFSTGSTYSYLAFNAATPKVLFAGTQNNGDNGQVDSINLLPAFVPPATQGPPVVTTSLAVVVNLKGIGLAMIGTPATPVLFALDAAGKLYARTQADLTKNYYTSATGFTITGAGGGTPGGMTLSATNIVFTDTASKTIRQLPLAGLGGTLALGNPDPVSPKSSSVVSAGAFSNVAVNGYNLQTNFEFTTDTPLGVFADGTILVGDDGAWQYRRVTLLTTATLPAGSSTFTTFAGQGIEFIGGVDGGPPANANLGGVATFGGANNGVGGIAVDSTGAVFFSDYTLSTIRKVTASVITSVAGIPGRPTGTLVSGVPALQATLNTPLGLAFNAAGELFIADNGNNLVRKLKTDGTIVTAVGTAGEAGNSGDQFDALSAHVNSPFAVTFDKNGDLYISQVPGAGVLLGTSSSNSSLNRGGQIRVVATNNIISTLAGNIAGDSPSYLPQPVGGISTLATGLTLDAAGKIYFADSTANISRIAGGNVQFVAGDGAAFAGYNGDGLQAARTYLNGPASVVASTALGLVVSDKANNRIRAIANLSESTGSPPTAVIVASQTLGAAPLKVTLDGTKSFDPDGDIVTYEWDFGDGSKGFGPVVDHIYAAVGSYNAKLTVTDSQGNKSTTIQVIIAAQTLISSQTSGKGSFKVNFSSKSTKPSDSFNLSLSGITGLKDESGQGVTLTIGSFVSEKATVSSKGSKNASKTLTVTIDTKKNAVGIKLKGVTLKDAFAALGVTNSNSLGGKGGIHIVVPVVLMFANGDVLGDQFGFTVTTKFNKGASGNFAQ